MSDEHDPLQKREDDPPVVARLVIEIRSDGTRTVARGALEDATTGETVSIESRGTTPAALALSMLESMRKLPLFATATAARDAVKSALRGLLPGRRK